MDNLLRKSVVQKGVRNMAVLGLGLAVSVGLTPVTTWASLQNQAEQSCRFNAKSQDSDNELKRVSAGEKIIMARGGNRSGGGGGGGMGQRSGGNSDSGYRYGPGDGAGTGDEPGDGTGYGAKKGAGTGDCDGTGRKERKGRRKGRN